MAQRDAATGTTSVEDHLIYDGFGQLLSETAAAFAVSQAFQGKFRDPLTGDQLHGERWRDALGWFSPDPSGLEPDANPYRFVGNAPTNFTDPSGLQTADDYPAHWGGPAPLPPLTPVELARMENERAAKKLPSPTPPAPGAAAKNWRAYSRQVIGGDAESPANDNGKITKGYARLYLRRPSVYYWPGLAALASDMVGLGITGSEAAACVAMTGIINKRFNELDEYADDVTHYIRINKALREGNTAVFEDIYWQFEAYDTYGISEMRDLYRRRQIPRATYRAWEQIDFGAQNDRSDMIWKGNESILRFEQEVTLQKAVYDKYEDVMSPLSPVMACPLRKGPSFQEVVPGGDISDFADRWKWVSRMSQLYKAIHEKDRNIVGQHLTERFLE